MVLKSRRIVVVHPPKTGGQALQKALTGSVAPVTYYGARRHDTLEQIWEKVPNISEWRSYILVRNPYARMVSLWHYQKQTPMSHTGAARAYVRAFDSCEQFLEHAEFEALEDPELGWRDGGVLPLVRYGEIHGAYQNWLIPIPMESLEEVARYEFAVEVAPFNVSQHLPWWRYYNERSAARVAAHYAEDFERYRYDIESWRETGGQNG